MIYAYAPKETPKEEPMIENKSYGDRFQDDHKPSQKGKTDTSSVYYSIQQKEYPKKNPIDKRLNVNGDPKSMREFETGATRNLDEDKLDFEGFFSPLALEEFAKYMHTHRLQADGNLRDSDNWQKGIPLKAYMKSMYRHFFDTWKRHRGLETPEDQITNLCGLMFNAQGMLHELLKNK